MPIDKQKLEAALMAAIRTMIADGPFVPSAAAIIVLDHRPPEPGWFATFLVPEVGIRLLRGDTVAQFVAVASDLAKDFEQLVNEAAKEVS